MSGRPSDSLTPELELMILSARQRLTDSQTERVGEILRGDLNWDAVLGRSRALGVHSLLRRHLCAATSPFAIPERVRQNLEEQYRFQALVNLRLWNQLVEIGEAFNRARIPLVLLKGAYLAYWVYEDPALRPVSDLDLLCREQDWVSAKELLKMLGYTQLSQRSIDDLLSLHPPAFTKPKATRVEIHLALTRRLTGKELVDRAQELERRGIGFLTLDFHDHVDYLVAHLAQHWGSKARLCWFTDLHEMLIRGNNGSHGNADRLFQPVWRDHTQALIWSFLNRHWVNSDPSPAGCPESADVIDRLAGDPPSLAQTYLYALAGVGRFPGIRPKFLYLRRLFFPPLGQLAERNSVRPGLGAYLWYLARFVSIPARILKSVFISKAGPR